MNAWRASAFDDVDFDGLDFDADFFEPLDGFFDVFAFAFEFETDDADFVGDAGLAHVGDDGEFLGELPDHRVGDELGRIHEPQAGFLRARIFSGFGGHRLAAGDGRDDADFVAVFDRGLLVLQEADVLLVDVDVDEAADGTVFIKQAVLDAGVTGLQFRNEAANGGGADLDQFFVVGELAEGRGDSNVFCHKLFTPRARVRPGAAGPQIRASWA